jgi:hypothetical protein
MRGSPFDLRFELGNKRMRLVHGSPHKVHLFEDKPVPARLFGRGGDGDPPAAGPSQRSGRRAHPRGERVALASASALPRARALTGAAGSLNHSRVLDRVERRLRKMSAGARVRVARERVALSAA